MIVLKQAVGKNGKTYRLCEHKTSPTGILVHTKYIIQRLYWFGWLATEPSMPYRREALDLFNYKIESYA